jgi:hypothetical protein
MWVTSIGGLTTHSYSPGTATGLLLWLPLGGAILYQRRIRNCRVAWYLGLILGTAMNFGVLLLTMNLGRIP